MQADQLVGELMSVLERRGELDTTNIIITGLHGFVDVSAESAVDISNLAESKALCILRTLGCVKTCKNMFFLLLYI